VERFARIEVYPDKMTYDLVGAACVELGVSGEVLLRAFGAHWVKMTAASGYGDLFDISAGSEGFWGVLKSLDHLHARLEMSLPDLQPPHFWCSEISAGSARLHYQSKRPGLAPMVVGLLEGLAAKYGQQVEIRHDRKKAEGAEHDEFLIEAA
jgi:Haem-NO-binding